MYRCRGAAGAYAHLGASFLGNPGAATRLQSWDPGLFLVRWREEGIEIEERWQEGDIRLPSHPPKAASR